MLNEYNYRMLRNMLKKHDIKLKRGESGELYFRLDDRIVVVDWVNYGAGYNEDWNHFLVEISTPVKDISGIENLLFSKED